MKGKRILSVMLCGILLLGGCGRPGAEEDGKHGEDSAENVQDIQEDAGQAAPAADGEAGADESGQETADNTGSAKDALVIEMGPDKAVWEDGNLILTLHDFRLSETPEDVSIHLDDMVITDAEYYMDRSKFLTMQADIRNIDYKGSLDDGSINISMITIQPVGGEEQAGEEVEGESEWAGSYPVYLSEAGTGETDYYHVAVNEGETKSVTIGFYVPVKDEEELRARCRIEVGGQQYFEIPETSK